MAISPMKPVNGCACRVKLARVHVVPILRYRGTGRPKGRPVCLLEEPS